MPMQVRRLYVVNCPHCGAENPVREIHCRSCSKPLTLYIGPAESLPRRFGLGSLMFLVAVVALGLGVLRFVPVLGVTILVLLIPAVVRTTAFVSQRESDLRPISFDEKMMAFFGSIGVMMLVLVAASLTFAIIFVLIAAMTLGTGPYSVPVAGAFSGSVAISITYVLLRKLWPYKD
jgi:hypothetical protein